MKTETKKQTNRLTIEDAIIIQNSIKSMGNLVIDDMITALAIVKNKRLLDELNKENAEAISLAVNFTEEEKELSQKIRDLGARLNEGNTNEMFKKLDALENANPSLTASLKEKNKLYAQKEKDILKQPCNIDFHKIDKSNFTKKVKVGEVEQEMNILSIAQLEGLSLIFK